MKVLAVVVAGFALASIASPSAANMTTVGEGSTPELTRPFYVANWTAALAQEDPLSEASVRAAGGLEGRVLSASRCGARTSA